MSEAPGGKVAVLAKIPAQPGKRDELVKALEAAIDNANTEAGTLLYILHVDPKDDSAVYFYELYTDQDALTAEFLRHEVGRLGCALPNAQSCGKPKRRALAFHTGDADIAAH